MTVLLASITTDVPLSEKKGGNNLIHIWREVILHNLLAIILFNYSGVAPYSHLSYKSSIECAQQQQK